jgi:Fe-S cluster assembly protein SufD
MTPVPLPLPGLDPARAAALFADEPASAAAWRRAAIERYAAMPAPTAADEDWRRTPVERFPFAQRTLSPPLPWTEGRVEHPLADGFALVIAVGPDRITVDRRNPDAGIEARSLIRTLDGTSGAPSAPWTALWPAPIPHDAVDAAMDAFGNAGLRLRVPRNTPAEAASVLVLHRPAAGSLLLPQVYAEAEAGAALDLVEWAETPHGPAMIAAAQRVLAGPGAHTRTLRVQAMDDASHWIARDHVRADRDAHAETMQIHLGGRVIKTLIGGDAAGAGAHLAFRGFALGSGRRHLDQHTAQVHTHADTTSHLLFKCVVRDEAYSLYRGLIAAVRGSVRIDAYQKNNNLVLNKGARADSLPGLLIDADDLKCSHGATIGSLDPEQLFYLRARGLPETAARRMLIEAFGGEILDGLAPPALCDQVRALAAAQLE